MAERLRGCRVLVAEDELQSKLESAGAVVLGPVSRLAQTTALIQSEQDIDAAILDANLGGEMVYPAADLLAEKGIPLVFATGYDASAIPIRFQHIPRFEKPIDVKRVAQALGRDL